MTGARVIERIGRVDPEELFRTYFLPGRPVVIADLFDDAALRRVDTVDRARALIGDTLLDIQPNYMNFLRTGRRGAARPMTLAAYLDLVRADPATSDLCVEYATPPELEALLSPAPCRTIRDPMDVVSATFVANGGNFNHLHFDDDQRDVLLYQVFGTKRFAIITPDESRRLDAYVAPGPGTALALARVPARDANGRVFIEHLSDAERAAFLDYAGAWVCDLGPGDTLYTPMLAWHFVEYVDTAMSVTYRLGRNRYNRLLASAMPQPTAVGQMVGWRFRDAARVDADHPDVARELEAACTGGGPIHEFLAAAYDRLYGGSAAALVAMRDLYHRTLVAACSEDAR